MALTILFHAGFTESGCTQDECRCRECPFDATNAAMFNMASLIIGFVALVCALVAFLPFLGWLNWLIIPLAVIGAALGLISRGNAGRNLNLLVIAVGVVRLVLGGGIL